MGLLSSRVLRCSDSSPAEAEQPEATAGPSFLSGNRKRKQRSWDCSGPGPSSNIHGSQNQGINLQQVFGIVCRKKVKLSSKRAYQSLFLDGEDSDIKIRALGKTWPLHKVFLCQSGYFANMLKGSWKDSHNDIIELEIKNEDIDVRSLYFVFGSLYRDEVLPIKPLQVPHVLAAASLLQVEHVVHQCKETMMKTINMKNVCLFYTAAETYRLKSVKTQCFKWLLSHLMTHPSVGLYKEIDIKLMYLLVSSSDLLVMQTEIDIYTTLKEWIFLYLNPHWKGSVEQLLASANSWLSKHMEGSESITFLESEEGLIFQPVFKKLRFQHIICDLASTTLLERDRLIPLEWLSPVYKQQWLTLLHSQQHKEIGPGIINEKELEGCSMRCGTKINRDGKYSWKWSHCKFSFPLHIIFTNRYIIFKQNRQPCDGSACLKQIRNVVYRMTLAYFDSNGKLTFSRTTGYKTITFKDNEEQIAMKLDGIILSFPLYVFCNFLFTSLANMENM
ncbi:germ cell-less protein-like 2 [Onychomys torridus]|uniref:germ cell-less protein-like 2 n=1 Tax=Onychomys torridus TaxID=38674 RepID=UPI00167FD726|nr:germ cell-less protein-like 2 [Onychomys torridus]